MSSHSLKSFSWALLFTMGFGFAAWHILSVVIQTPLPEQVAAAIGMNQQVGGQLVKPEPVESAVFVLTILAGIAALSFAASRRPNDRPSTLASLLPSTLALILVVSWFARMDPYTILPPNPSFLIEAVRTNPERFGWLLLASIPVVFALNFLSYRRGGKYLPVAMCVLPLACLSAMVVFGNDDPYLGSTHYEVFAFPIAQDWLGSGIHLGQKSQYGMYPVFLRPIWHLTGGPTTGAITATMGALLLASNLALVLFVTRYSRHPLLGACFAFAGIIVSLLLYPFWPGDAYFEFFPVRLVFPALAFAFLCSYRMSVNHQFLAYSVLALGLAWNFESGVVALVVYGVFSVAYGFTPEARAFVKLAARHAAMALFAVVLTAGVVTGYYLLRFGQPPEFAGIAHSIRAFSSGAGAEPMPKYGAWGLYVLVYCVAVFVGVRTLWAQPNAEDKRQAAALLAMAAAGLLWLRYYQGRSLPLPLTFVSWPAICCLGLLIDRLVSNRPGQRTIAAIVSLAVAAPVAVSLGMWLYGQPAEASRIEALLANRGDARMNLAVDRAVGLFDTVKQSDQDELFVYAPYTQLVQLRLGKPSVVRAAGLCQMWFEDEINQAAAALSAPTTRMVLFDGRPGCPTLGASLPTELKTVLARDFYEIDGGPGCLRLPTEDRKIYLRNGTPMPTAAPAATDGTNLAFGKLATSSVAIEGGDASNAVDGNTSGDFTKGSTSHTHLAQSPRLDIDLGAVHRVDQVEVWNRTDCCGERLRDYWVFMSTTPFHPHDSVSDLLQRKDDARSLQTDSPCPSSTVRLSGPARYVRVQLAGEGYLSLAEVQVRGATARSNRGSN